MKKEYKYNITSTAAGNMWEVEVLHDGQYVSEMRKYFNHLYRGKAPSRTIVKKSRDRAEEYIAELESKGYVLCEAQARELRPFRTQPRKTNDSILARLRMERGLTQAQLAEMTGFPHQYISRWERGERNPGAKALIKLAAALNCQITDLIEV